MKAGYQGKDAMRSKAEKMFKSEGKEKTKAFKKGGSVKKASGGSVYEREMIGEKASSKRPHINYESDMKGEKPTRKAFAKGGEVKLAIGGSGKIRHNEMTKKGAPICRKSNKRDSYK
jgi:hypothetical protein